MCRGLANVSLSSILLADKHDWRDTRGKYQLVRNPDRNWWHRPISLKLFLPYPWHRGQRAVINWIVLTLSQLFYYTCIKQQIELIVCQMTKQYSVKFWNTQWVLYEEHIVYMLQIRILIWIPRSGWPDYCDRIGIWIRFCNTSVQVLYHKYHFDNSVVCMDWILISCMISTNSVEMLYN